MPKDYYEILGVPRSASSDDVKRAYRKLAHQYHPDKGGDTVRFKEISEAYGVLGNAEKRRQYDQFGAAFDTGAGAEAGGFGFDPSGRAGGFDIRFEDLGGFGDLFSTFFGGSPFGTRTRERQRGADIEVGITIPFEEMVKGARREFPLNRHRTCMRCRGNRAEPGTKIVTCGTCGGSGMVERHARTFLGSFVQRSACSSCRGDGKRAKTPCRACGGEGRTRRVETLVVKIPAGIEDGTRLRIAGEGEAPRSGGDPGDLYIRVGVAEHPRFRREGGDVVSDAHVPFPVAALGGDATVETVWGEERVRVPAGTASGAVVRIPGKGIAGGDHRAKVTIDVPKKLTRKQKDLLRQFEEESKKKGMFWA